MKIAYLCQFSHPSICGVWNRVYNLAKEMIKKGHEVHVFSSDVIKGTNKRSGSYDLLEGIHIHRSPLIFNLGENGNVWNFKKELIKLKPDIIDAQVYRHNHSNMAPYIAEKISAKAVLTTHAPFHVARNPVLAIATFCYDFFAGRDILKKYNKIITITKWENSYLKNLGVPEHKINYISNGINKELLKHKDNKTEDSILFFGRISPVKNIEVLIEAFSSIIKEYKNFKLKIVGPIDESYRKKLTKLINKKKLHKNIIFIGPVYDLKEKIKTINSSKIFVLPSLREAMPQSLIEAMALGRLVISSTTDGGKDIIKDGYNGFLFKIKDLKELESKLRYGINNYNKLSKIRANAVSTVKDLTWNNLANKVERVYFK